MWKFRLKHRWIKYGMRPKNLVCMNNAIFVFPPLPTCQKKEGEPQQFTYSRTVGPFYKVEGWGKSADVFHKDDVSRISSLQFGTYQKLSPIRVLPKKT